MFIRVKIKSFVESHKVQFWDHCCFCYTLMTCVMCLKKKFSLLFADDSKMFVSGKDPDLIRTMNEEMVKVVDWLQINRLSLNWIKTHFILFQRKRARVSLSADVIINNVKIDIVKKTKFLGVIINQNMSFQKIHKLYWRESGSWDWYLIQK